MRNNKMSIEDGVSLDKTQELNFAILNALGLEGKLVQKITLEMDCRTITLATIVMIVDNNQSPKIKEIIEKYELHPTKRV